METTALSAPSNSSSLDSSTWRRDGVVRVRGIIEEHWLELLREAAYEIRDEVADAPDEKDPSGFLTQLDLWTRNDKIARFMRESRLPEVAARVMESDEIRLYHDILILKEQGCEEPTPWHQDSPSWEAVGRQLCGMWFCLDPVGEETGSLRLVRGSHEGPLYSHPRELSGASLDLPGKGGPLPAVDADPQRFPVPCYELEAGDVVLFHPSVLHSARGAARDGARISYSFRMMGDDVRFRPCPSSGHACAAELGFEPGDKLIADRFPLLWRHGCRPHDPLPVPPA
jgi:ectoine hydroxylase-related dioxygenase (phytanoyl-CoA dioxygenase family)